MAGQQDINAGQYYGNFGFGGASLEYQPGYFKSVSSNANENGELRDGEVYWPTGSGRASEGAVLFKNGKLIPVDVSSLPEFQNALANRGKMDVFGNHDYSGYFGGLEAARNALSQKLGKPVNPIGVDVLTNYYGLLDRQKRPTADAAVRQAISIDQIPELVSKQFTDLGMPEKTADQLRAERTQPLPGTPYTGPGAMAASQGGVPQGEQKKYQVLNPEALKKYKPSEVTKQADGSITLNPGVTPIPGTTKEISGTAGTQQEPQYQVLNPEALKKYSASQVTKRPDGTIVLNPGVTPIPGTTKQLGGTTTSAGNTTASGGTTQPGGATEKKDFTDISSLPDRIKNDPAFQALSEDNKALAAFQWNSMQASDALTKIRAKEALIEATKLAQPAFKQALLLATDDIERNLSSFLAGNTDEQKKLEVLLDQKKQDLISKADQLTATEVESALKDMESIRIIKDQAIREGESREAGVAADLGRINRRMSALSEDLKYGREQLSIEEQAQLSRSLREYERSLQSTQEAAADAGLGFSSIRTEAEKRLAEDLQDVSESTRRQKMRELRALETESGRTSTELLATQADIDRKNQEARVDIARQIEKKVGWDGVPPELKKLLPDSMAPLGIRGEATEVAQKRERELKLQREQIATERTRAEQEAARQQQILERKREEGVLELERAKEKTVGTGNLGATDLSRLTTIGEKPLGDIQGSLEAEQAQRAQAIQESILKTQPQF